MQKILFYLSIYKKKIIISLSVLLFIVGFLSFMLINSRFNAETITNNIDIANANHMIKVDVKGAVINPGVYELNSNDRVIEAINKAGGFSLNAYQMNLNLAKRLKDEAVIIVNTLEEVDYYKLSKVPIVCQNSKKFDNNGICELYNIAELDFDSNNDTDALNSFVNINSASIEELTTLDGIGESKAIKIIEYRNLNNGFKNIEELMNVDGIGERLYEMVKDNITV